jgi:uncharacterized protein (TIGR03067 family)
MKRTAVLLVCVLGIAAGEKEAGKKAADPIEGAWTILSDVVYGKPVDLGEDSPKMIFKAGKMHIEYAGKPQSETTYKLLGGKEPAAIDIALPPVEGRVVVQEGIYTVKDGELRICLGIPRPKEFKAAKDTILLILKRDKP